jgi:hypothetical protein
MIFLLGVNATTCPYKLSIYGQNIGCVGITKTHLDKYFLNALTGNCLIEVTSKTIDLLLIYLHVSFIIFCVNQIGTQ